MPVLTAQEVKALQPKDRRYKKHDTGGLYIEVGPGGGKWWRFRYQFQNKEHRLSVGTFPAVSLKEARIQRDEYRIMLSRGIDPKSHRESSQEAPADTFRQIALEWHAINSPQWSTAHTRKVLQRLNRDLLPHIGDEPINSIEAPTLLQVIRRIEKRGAIETAHRARSDCSSIFRFAIASGRATRDPAADIRGALAPIPKAKHFAATMDESKLGDILRAIHIYRGGPVVSCALRLAPYVFVRPGELRHARWTDINFDEAQWRFKVTKTDVDHIVPLARQSLEILREVEAYTRANSPFVFPSERSWNRPMSENGVLVAMRSCGISQDEMSGHGWRAVARTLLDEKLKYRPEIIEKQLAHVVRDPLRGAYNRTAFLPERIEMLQAWADYLDSLRDATQ